MTTLCSPAEILSYLDSDVQTLKRASRSGGDGSYYPVLSAVLDSWRPYTPDDLAAYAIQIDIRWPDSDAPDYYLLIKRENYQLEENRKFSDFSAALWAGCQQISNDLARTAAAERALDQEAARIKAQKATDREKVITHIKSLKKNPPSQ